MRVLLYINIKVIDIQRTIIYIFRYVPEWPFEQIGVGYTSSPFFNLDYDVISGPTTYDGIPTAVVQRKHSMTVTPANIIHSQLVNTQGCQLSAESNVVQPVKQCRELLKQLLEFTFLCTDENIVGNLKVELEGVVNQYYAHLPSVHGIPLNKRTPKRQRADLFRPRKKKLPPPGNWTPIFAILFTRGNKCI